MCGCFAVDRQTIHYDSSAWIMRKTSAAGSRWFRFSRAARWIIRYAAGVNSSDRVSLRPIPPTITFARGGQKSPPDNNSSGMNLYGLLPAEYSIFATGSNLYFRSSSTLFPNYTRCTWVFGFLSACPVHRG